MDTLTCPTHHLRIRDLKVDPLRRQCTLRGEPIPLTGTEFAILSFLMENKGRVVPVRELSDAVWQDEVYVDREDCLAVHVKHIREKLHDRKPFATVKPPGAKATGWNNIDKRTACHFPERRAVSCLP